MKIVIIIQGAWARFSARSRVSVGILTILVTLIFGVLGGSWIIGTSRANSEPEKPKIGKVGSSAADPDAETSAAMDIKVGINNRYLHGNEASVFSDCNINLHDLVWLTNEADEFLPSIIVEVTQVVARREAESKGCLFIGKDATRRLNLFPNKAGVKGLKARKLKKPDKSTSKEALRLPPFELNFFVKK